MKMKNVKKFVTVLFLAVLIPGCSAFRSEIRGNFDAPPEKNYGAKKVSILFVFSHVRQSKGYDAIPKLEDQRQRIDGFDDILQDALNELSNIKKYATFTDYSSDVNNPERRALKDSLITQYDYVMNIRILREKSFAKHFMGYIFSTATVTLLPVPYSKIFSVNADIYDSNGLLVRSYKRNASLTKWTQAFLIFLYPFHPEKRKTEEIYVAFLHDIFKQIETEKILTKERTKR